jgi:hypothetical protein
MFNVVTHPFFEMKLRVLMIKGTQYSACHRILSLADIHTSYRSRYPAMKRKKTRDFDKVVIQASEATLE